MRKKGRKADTAGEQMYRGIAGYGFSSDLFVLFLLTFSFPILLQNFNFFPPQSK